MGLVEVKATAPSTAPTAIPALATVDRPLSFALDVPLLGDDVGAVLLGMGALSVEFPVGMGSVDGAALAGVAMAVNARSDIVALFLLSEVMFTAGPLALSLRLSRWLKSK